MDNNALFAMTLTVIAGLATGLGSVIALFSKRTNTKFLAGSLGFSAGVMLYAAMVEIFAKSQEYLTGVHGLFNGNALTVLSFFGGIIFIGVIDYLVPSTEGDIGCLKEGGCKERALQRMGIITALTIGIHNFPEGLSTFTSALKDPRLGMAIATAIAIHNIPEGIATSVPIYFATGSKLKAFTLSFFSGITEPLGALIGYLVLRPFLNDTVFGILFGMIAGIMVFIAIEELLPMAREYEKSKITIISAVSGMLIMAVSLLMFL